MKLTKFGFVKITAHVKASQVLTPILMAIAAIGLISGLSACGSGAVGSPPDTTPVASTPLAVSPPTADLFPDVPATFTITGGKPGYSAFSSNSVVLPVTATLPGTTFTVIPGAVTAETAVDITVKDAANASASAKATVKPSTLINQITFTPSAPTATGCGTALCSGNDAQVVVKAALNGVVLRSRQIRFDVLQGMFDISPASSSPLCTTKSCTVSTDGSGEATVRIVANANASTQSATLQVTDVESTQARKYNFNIVSNAGALSALPSETIVIKGERGVAGIAEGAGKCPPTAQVDYTIFGGTPPYSVASTGLAIATAEPSKIEANGGRFRATLSGCGQAAFSITDATGKAIQTALIDSQRGDSSAVTTTTQTLLVAPTFPLPLNVECPKSPSLTTKASATIAGTGNFVAAIANSVPADSGLVMGSSSGSLPASLTFTRSVGNAPTQITVNITDGKTIAQLNVTTPPTCP
jgi:hypothetical protein